MTNSITRLALFFALFAVPVSAQDICQEVAQERATYGATISPAEAVTILNTVAARTGWGLLAAPPGGNGYPHVRGRRVRLDRVVRPSDHRIFDVFIDGPDARPGEPERSGVAGPGCQDDGPVEAFLLVNPIIEPVAPGAPLPSVTSELDALLDLFAEHDAFIRDGLEHLRLQLVGQMQKLESLASDHAKQPMIPAADPNLPLPDDKGWERRYLLEKVLPVVLGAIATWTATR